MIVCIMCFVFNVGYRQSKSHVSINLLNSNNMLPNVISNLCIKNNEIHSHFTRNSNLLRINNNNNNIYLKSNIQNSSIEV